MASSGCALGARPAPFVVACAGNKPNAGAVEKMTYWEAWDRDVRPDRGWRRRPSKGQTGVQHGLRTRGCDLRKHENSHANLPGSSDDAGIIKALPAICNIGGRKRFSAPIPRPAAPAFSAA